jgi:hypothetical protein
VVAPARRRRRRRRRRNLRVSREKGSEGEGISDPKRVAVKARILFGGTEKRVPALE